MLWILLSCMLSYQEDGDLTTVSVEQTKSTHHYNYDNSIKSSVKIITLDESFELNGHGSGNYFKIGKHRFILTAAHLIKPNETLWADDTLEYVKLEILFVDYETDIAILVADKKLDSIKPINYKINEKENPTGLTVVYSGYPGDANLSLFNGMVSSCSKKACTMQGFALPGSSGSVIFDNSGKVVGVLSAVKMGYNGMSPFPELYPTLVYIARTRMYNRRWLKERLVKWKSSK